MRALITETKSWCEHCNEYTGLDGWGRSLFDNSVEIWCAKCGKVKQVIAYEDASPKFQDSLDRTIESLTSAVQKGWL